MCAMCFGQTALGGELRGHPGVDAHAGAYGQGDHQRLDRVNDGQGRQACIRIAPHEEAVHDAIERLDQLRQHDRRRELEENFADPLSAEKFRRVHGFCPSARRTAGFFAYYSSPHRTSPEICGVSAKSGRSSPLPRPRRYFCSGQRLAAEDREDAEFAVVGDALHVLGGLHVCSRNFEVHGGVARYMCRVCGLGQRHGAELDDVADAELWSGRAAASGYSGIPTASGCALSAA